MPELGPAQKSTCDLSKTRYSEEPKDKAEHKQSRTTLYKVRRRVDRGWRLQAGLTLLSFVLARRRAADRAVLLTRGWSFSEAD